VVVIVVVAATAAIVISVVFLMTLNGLVICQSISLYFRQDPLRNEQ